MAKETTTVHVCDRCKKRAESPSPPSGASDPWGRLKIDQPGAWDFQGKPVAARMSRPLLLCGACLEDVVAVVNGLQIRFDGPPGPEPGRFVEVENIVGAGVQFGTWVQDGDDWLLRTPGGTDG